MCFCLGGQSLVLAAQFHRRGRCYILPLELSTKFREIITIPSYLCFLLVESAYYHVELLHSTYKSTRTLCVVLSLLCPSRRSSSNKNETSLEADEPEHNHEGKLKTYREKKLVSADQPSLRRTSGAKDREIPQRLFVCS